MGIVKTVEITSNWARYWFLLIGVTLSLYGYFAPEKTALLVGILCATTSILMTVLVKVLTVFDSPIDNYAATIHRSIVESYFSQSSDTQLRDITPEFIARTTFARPDQYSSLRAFYHMITFGVVLLCITLLSKFFVGQGGVVLLSLIIAIIYTTDITFGIRSRAYFSAQDKLESPESVHIETITPLFAKRLDIEAPEIVYVDSETLIAGAINPIFGPSQLYISQNVLEKQQHIQTGIIAHELAHMYADEGGRYFSHRYLQLLIPIVLSVYSFTEISVVSTLALAVSVFAVSMLISAQQHREEYTADMIAKSVTKTEFIILAILELTPYNPFVDAFDGWRGVLSKISNTHPPSGKRINRLVSDEE